MSSRREVLTGIIAALISIVIVGGSFAIATTEVRSSVAKNMVRTPTLTSFPTHVILVTQRPGEPTFTPSPTLPPSITPTPEASSCQPPSGWSAIVLQPGDTLKNLAQTYNTTPETLKQANCLIGNSLVPGTIFYVPGAPPPTDIPCGPPPGWVYYIVQPGDTLYSIGRAYTVSIAQLQVANCMGSSTTIRVGQKLYVPNVAPNLPSSTPTLTETSSPKPSASPTLVPPSATSTNIPPSPTQTSVPPTMTPSLPTETEIIPTETPTSTDTPIPLTPTFTPTFTPTYTPSPEPTTLVPTKIPTSTTPATSTPYPTSTSTLTPTSTETLTPEPTPSPTPTSTSTPR